MTGAGGRPPDDIAPAELFRRLLAVPRPRSKLRFCFRGFEQHRLFAQALHAFEVAEALALSASEAVVSIVHKALYVGDHRAFRTSEELRDAVSETEFSRLASEVDCAFRVIAPSYQSSDVIAWHETLKRGARAHFPIAVALGGCVDVALGYNLSRTIERPDRFFGVPLGQLLDGHWMAYRAARELVAELKR